MRILKVLVWTGLCVAAGVALATVHVQGRTPLDHLQHGWKQAPGLEKVKGLASKDEAPTERHSEEDKESVNRLLARRKP